MGNKEFNNSMVMDAIAMNLGCDVIAEMVRDCQVEGETLTKAVQYYYKELCRPGRANVLTQDQAVEAIAVAFDMDSTDVDSILFSWLD